MKWEDKAGTPEINFRNCRRHNTTPVEYFSIVEDVTRPQKISEAEAARIRIDERTIFISSLQEVFSGILEIIYKVRCLLVHGLLEPTKENHDVVRHCYFVLQMMMDF